MSHLSKKLSKLKKTVCIKFVGSFLDVVVNVQECDIAVSEFELYSCFYVHVRIITREKGMSSLIPAPTMD